MSRPSTFRRRCWTISRTCSKPAVGSMPPGCRPERGCRCWHAAQASALMQGRGMVLPEDIQSVAIPVMAHRLDAGVTPGQLGGRDLARSLLETVPVG